MAAHKQEQRTTGESAAYLSNGPKLLRGITAIVTKEIQEPNLSYLLEFDQYLELNNMKERTRYKRMQELLCVCRNSTCMDFKKITEAQVKDTVRAINALALANYSKGRLRLVFKRFIIWLVPKKKELVEWIKQGGSAKSLKTPEDMLSEDDVLQLLNACKNQRNSTLIAMLWDTGGRVGELLALRMKDVVLAGRAEVSYAILTGKTGTRRVPLSVSIPYIAKYVNDLRKGAKSGGPFFITFDMHSNPTNNALDYPTVKTILADIRLRCGMEKRLHCHVFRYSRATYLHKKGMPSGAIKLFFGWENLNMLNHYAKLSGGDVDGAFLKAVGMEQNVVPEIPKLIPVQCGGCKKENEATAVFCIECHAPLGESDEVRLLRNRIGKLEEGIRMLMERDPKLREEVENTKKE